MSCTRRELLAGLSTSVLLSAGLLPRASAHEVRRSSKGPRYIVQIQLKGGIDAVLTVDPKRRRDVHATIDVPYEEKETLLVNDLWLGPHLEPLKAWIGQMSMLGGVQMFNANHTSGSLQIPRMRVSADWQMPTLLDIIGSHRDGQPLGNLTVGYVDMAYSQQTMMDLFQALAPGAQAEPAQLFQELHRLSGDELEMLSRVARRHSERAARMGGSESKMTARNLGDLAEFAHALKGARKFSPMAWFDDSEPGKPTPNDGCLQQTLWALENDLTRCAFVLVDDAWDSHMSNTRLQARASLRFFKGLARFFQELEQRSNAHGRLIDQTLVFFSSELGRFPVLNKFAGKDHFPEAPIFFFGSGVNTREGRGAKFGRSDARMQALPVSVKTGEVEKGGRLVTLNDVGVTLLKATGLDPTVYGYSGVPLPFLLTPSA